MHTLGIDIETYSSVSLPKSGLYAYVQSPDFEILLFAYSFDHGPVKCVDLISGETIPAEIMEMLHSPDVQKTAYNAAFEITCLSKIYGSLIISQWRDTMFKGLYAGYTAGLEATGATVGLPSDKQKLLTGKNLIRYFCVPCKPTKTNGGRTRNYPDDDPEKWLRFKEYNIQDVVTEQAISDRLSGIVVPDSVQKQWETDLIINTRGVCVDTALVEGAIHIGNRVTEELIDEAKTISGIRNPNSVKQLTRWLNAETDNDIEISDLRKETVVSLLDMGIDNKKVVDMLKIRQELGKTSTKKYDAIDICVCPDSRVRGLLQFYGASRTGRWAGRLVQVQNLPRTYIEQLDIAREAVINQNIDVLKVLFGNIPDTLSQLIRTAFIATPGNVFIDVDFSAIEARVISWLAGEEWRLEVFKTHGKIYEASASKIFNVPIERIVKGNPEYSLRQRGKVAELALGYQGGVGAMRRMDTGHALDSASDEEVKQIVDQWRDTNPRIRDLWYKFEDAAINVIKYNTYRDVNGVRFQLCQINDNTQALEIILPSGRSLYYINPTIGTNQYGNAAMIYYGVSQSTKKWTAIETYGGRLVENVIQAIARDCLAEAIEKLEMNGYPVVFHVHDEVVIDIKPYADNKTMLDDVIRLMRQPPSWASDLPLNADGWVGKYYRKD